jgi:hypothetical protein
VLESRDLVVFTHWTYIETYGDPYGQDRLGVAVDGFTDLTIELLENELQASFGDRVDRSGLYRLLRTEGRRMAIELIEVEVDGSEDKPLLWSQVLSRHGVPVVEASPDEFWSAQAEPFSEWVRERFAEALSTTDYTIEPRDLVFWPNFSGDTVEEDLNHLAVRTWGSEEALNERVMPLFEIMAGYYGDFQADRFRFRTGVELPGTVIRTNGTVDDDMVVWFFRGADLVQGKVVMQAETVEINDRALRSLGVRRELTPLELLELTDLLTIRDPEDALKELLALAVEDGNLEILEKEGTDLYADDLVALLRGDRTD